MIKNKVFLTNFGLVLITASGFILKSDLLKTIGFFGLSGSITNSLAVHMIFEKVPFLYGSGVIILKFEDFKKSIKNMILHQFFSENNLNKFFKNKELNIKQFVDNDEVFEKLKEAIIVSQFGAIINMFGGESALEPLRSPLSDKLSEMIYDVEFKIQQKGAALISTQEIEKILDSRLSELEARDIKNLVQSIIRQHLSLLVVWGGVFGALLGAISFFVIKFI